MTTLESWLSAVILLLLVVGAFKHGIESKMYQVNSFCQAFSKILDGFKWKKNLFYSYLEVSGFFKGRAVNCIWDCAQMDNSMGFFTLRVQFKNISSDRSSTWLKSTFAPKEVLKGIYVKQGYVEHREYLEVGSGYSNIRAETLLNKLDQACSIVEKEMAHLN